MSMVECPVQTEEGVKAADVAWMSLERRSSKPNDPAYLIAPEICIEVLSPSHVEGEMNERKRLLLQKGAVEFWFRGLDGEISLFDPAGAMHGSRLCPDFPKRLTLG